MYAGQADMVERFGESEMIQLTDREGRTGAIVPEVLEKAIDDSVSLIHGYLAGRYSVPLNPVPHLATRWTVDLTRWFLQPNAAPDQVKANYQRTLDELKAVAAGEITLEADDNSGLWSGAAEISAPPRMFDGKFGGY